MGLIDRWAAVGAFALADVEVPTSSCHHNFSDTSENEIRDEIRCFLRWLGDNV